MTRHAAGHRADPGPQRGGRHRALPARRAGPGPPPRPPRDRARRRRLHRPHRRRGVEGPGRGRHRLADRRQSGGYDARATSTPAWPSPPGELLCRVDARSIIPPEYVRLCAEVLGSRPEVMVTGGAQVAIAVDDSARSVGIARALNNKYAMGGSRYRSGADSGPCDTVYLGAFRTAQLRSAGGWDEYFETNQDFELNRRLGRAGVVWFDSRLEVGLRAAPDDHRAVAAVPPLRPLEGPLLAAHRRPPAATAVGDAGGSSGASCRCARWAARTGSASATHRVVRADVGWGPGRNGPAGDERPVVRSRRSGDGDDRHGGHGRSVVSRVAREAAATRHR